MKISLNLKKISCPLCFFWQSENEKPIHPFHGYIKINLLWYKFKAKIGLPVNARQSAIFGFLNYINNYDILIICFNFFILPI